MKQFLGKLTVILAMLFIGQFVAEAQTTGSIAGTVIDQNGAVVPNATVTVTGEGVRNLPLLPARTEHIEFPLSQTVSIR